MDPVRSWILVLAIVVLAFAPWVVDRVKAHDAKARQPAPPVNAPARFPEQVALGRTMYGNAVAWDAERMAEYDQSLPLQAMWIAEAGYRLQGR